eukprot:CAMPEP_0196587844 /NCGR_PEP_ID=MMETSP1081-20130531/58779_1 /TAXON_ID=36882 /ORGANISM="Pyramimonas amylifera, Strain CCMP720" /LENGTH=85 /DNA_ID=CAMNT_0041910147 /DNA_START=1 /DNA_END=254 /DNA_ORIENTATION=+
MAKMGVQPDAHVFTLLLRAYSLSHSSGRVQALAANMHHKGLPRTLQVVNAHIDALGRCGEWEEAEVIWKEASSAPAWSPGGSLVG